MFPFFCCVGLCPSVDLLYIQQKLKTRFSHGSTKRPRCCNQKLDKCIVGCVEEYIGCAQEQEPKTRGRAPSACCQQTYTDSKELPGDPMFASLFNYSKNIKWGWRDGSEVKSTGCSSRGPDFNSQQPRGSQPSVMRSGALFWHKLQWKLQDTRDAGSVQHSRIKAAGSEWTWG